MKQKNFTAISLFSGAGGMDVGFQASGFEILWANDIDKNACETYARNFGPHILCGDINAYLASLCQYEGVDLIFGGPPCQGFSVAGKMDPDDSRSQLVWSFLEAVKRVRPRLFVMENVKALAHLSKFEAIRQRMFQLSSDMGYTVDLVVLNAKDYGVPQSRERMFLVGYRETNQPFSFQTMVSRYKSPSTTVREIITPLGRAGSPSNSRVCKARITIAAKPVLRKSPYAGMLFNGQGRPINPDTASCTLHASMGGNRTPIIDERHLFDHGPSWVESYHAHLMDGGAPYPFEEAPDFLRRLTVDEALRLQTFPENYDFFGTQSTVFRQIGNAVPCKLAESVAQAASDLLSGNLIENSDDRQLALPLPIGPAKRFREPKVTLAR